MTLITYFDSDNPERRAKPPSTMTQVAPFPHDLLLAIAEFRDYYGWRFTLADEDRGQDCSGLTLDLYPNKPDSYHPERHVNTRFLYPVPAAAFNRESWEEYLWARIEETEGHERAENFVFIGPDSKERRPFKPAHPDGWDPGVVRSVVSETVTNTPNAGRLVSFPCGACPHTHTGRMGEHFVIETAFACRECGCEAPCSNG
jgi:hypothetical protein